MRDTRLGALEKQDNNQNTQPRNTLALLIRHGGEVSLWGSWVDWLSTAHHVPFGHTMGQMSLALTKPFFVT